MRPARKGPENLVRHALTDVAGSFNEAGPQGAGKPLRRWRRRVLTAPAFNEAGPQGAGKRRLLDAATSEEIPSMRPARKGPENAEEKKPASAVCRTFNEAGPQGAGKPRAAGKVAGEQPVPSMRPARKGPENGWMIWPSGSVGGTFNEAGPQGAGKH